MTKKPILNALAAVAYISLVATLMFYGPHIEGKNLGVLIPITMLSLFVFSAATMGFIFFYWPVRLYFDGEKEKAAGLFLKTLVFFGVITAVILLTTFLV
ncbi:hypothetical protein A2930_04150 [Candidatus Giovannonibacteria bacterium RIFCSPLOWO2_01_FULL_45_34]|uniref:Uncharacterized protein n=1 Tax=Candidatus Giovannonibacteria bacterium RIFCSPLOWO2_01_FULL_45_34 TaxID=1798351 RepID=A0A1F5X282_9BACT|nr:MAG: hypothetical protein A3C73_04595 [Candidatus Giovannonibacteria bacterium RIFCSPHIGHO2_02_FULL_44_11]OGF81661.1 MAG: hypothetical protein A2930_04150 [Candidatus Giovannonibacteria bacterium RIFCSPLOWO2_01_FULL_45_34]